MTPINSLIRNTPLDLSSIHNLPSINAQPGQGLSGRNGNSPVSFAATSPTSQVDFGVQNNLLRQPRNDSLDGAANPGDPLAQLITLIQDMLQRLQALMQGRSSATNEPSKNLATGAGGGSHLGARHDLLDSKPSTEGTQQPGKTGENSPAGNNFSEHSLGNQLSVQKSSEDSIGMANDPERGNVIKVDFNKGHYTEHSTSPRAEIKDGTKLQEGQPYSFKFGMKREANNDGTFFQVLDHNNAKPSPRAWLATKDGQYQLHLKTSEDSDAPSKVFNIGKPGDAAKDVGKWADFQIDFKRGIGDGEISVTKNGENVFDKKGISTMFDTHSSDSYAKFGQYRNEGDHSPATSLFSGFSVAQS
jgi:hypothetical protein